MAEEKARPTTARLDERDLVALMAAVLMWKDQSVQNAEHAVSRAIDIRDAANKRLGIP